MKLYENFGERCVFMIEHVDKVSEQVEQATLSIGLIRKIQDEMGIRFDARWRKMEEKQCSILEVRPSCPKRQLNMLSPSRRLLKSSLPVLQRRKASCQHPPTL